MPYSVRIQPEAVRQVDEYGRWFAEKRQVPEIARQWVDRVYDAMMALSDFPFRCELAPESGHRSYEIRRLVIGDYLALFTVDEETKTVHVIGFRHGHRFPRTEELPKEEPK